ncbi:MAG TPA: hypothetical protein VFE50_01660 [Cyclobacteriaceae bacterium]|nr:hypothetical protein [Cyclobacteriaceae bacterium]
MKRMAYDRLMTARIKNSLMMFVMILATVLLFYKMTLNSRNPGAPAFDVITVISMVILVALTALIFSIQKFVASIDDEKFATYTRIGWAKVGLKTFNKTQREFVMIEQDAEDWYCLTIKTREGDAIVIDKYATLDHATGPLQQLKKVVT